MTSVERRRLAILPTPLQRLPALERASARAALLQARRPRRLRRGRQQGPRRWSSCSASARGNADTLITPVRRVQLHRGGGAGRPVSAAWTARSWCRLRPAGATVPLELAGPQRRPVTFTGADRHDLDAWSASTRTSCGATGAAPTRYRAGGATAGRRPRLRARGAELAGQLADLRRGRPRSCCPTGSGRVPRRLPRRRGRDRRDLADVRRVGEPAGRPHDADGSTPRELRRVLRRAGTRAPATCT
jgi:hypothetical protein